jgi:N-acetylglucosamine-6-phosphate deacetylase
VTHGEGATSVVARLILEDRVVGGRLAISDGVIAEVTLLEEPSLDAPYVAPGYVDLHVHGWGGHDAMGGRRALDGMARALLRRGVTSFLPTAVTAPLDDLAGFAVTVRSWQAEAPADGAQPLGFNLEGPFLAAARRGAHDPEHLLTPAGVPAARLDTLVDGLRLLTVAPELDGALDLIRWLRDRGVATSIGHSSASYEQARAGYEAGARSTTHLFNAMTGVEHRSPGVAVAALLDDAVYVELIADGVHVHPAISSLITRIKPVDRLMLVSDGISLAGTEAGRGRIGGLDVEVVGSRVTLAGTDTIAGSVTGLDAAVGNLVAAGVSLPAAVSAATRNPLTLIGIADRGRLAPGQRADLVELDGDLRVRRVMRAGAWFDASGHSYE